MVVCLVESVLLGYIITSKVYFKMSETNYPVTVSHALEEQNSDVRNNVGLYVHSPHSLRENLSVYSQQNITKVIPVVTFLFIRSSQSAAWVVRFQTITDVSLFSI